MYDESTERALHSGDIQPSEGLDSDPIIHSLAESLFGSQMLFGRLYRDMTKEKLNLLQFTTRIVANRAHDLLRS